MSRLTWGYYIMKQHILTRLRNTNRDKCELCPHKFVVGELVYYIRGRYRVKHYCTICYPRMYR